MRTIVLILIIPVATHAAPNVDQARQTARDWRENVSREDATRIITDEYDGPLLGTRLTIDVMHEYEGTRLVDASYSWQARPFLAAVHRNGDRVVNDWIEILEWPVIQATPTIRNDVFLGFQDDAVLRLRRTLTGPDTTSEQILEEVVARSASIRIHNENPSLLKPFNVSWPSQFHDGVFVGGLGFWQAPAIIVPEPVLSLIAMAILGCCQQIRRLRPRARLARPNTD